MNAFHKLPIFQNLPVDELQWLLDHGRELELGKGDFLMCEGDPAPRFYITLAGELQITRTIGGQEVVRGTTPPGIMAGEISLLYNTPSQVSVRAIQPSSVLVFDQPAFRKIFATCPVMAARIFQTAGARNENDYVMIEVADSGSGIPADVLPRIFEPFFTTKGVGAGVGLGLDMVYRIVTQHGGSIDVQSQPGHTRFIVRLPVAFAGKEG